MSSNSPPTKFQNFFHNGTQHKWKHPALTTAKQAGSWFTYPGGMEGWADLGDWIHTEMVYPPANGQPSQY